MRSSPTRSLWVCLMRRTEMRVQAPVAVADLEHVVALLVLPEPGAVANGHFLANSLAGLRIIHPAHRPADKGLTVEHGLARLLGCLGQLDIRESLIDFDD